VTAITLTAIFIPSKQVGRQFAPHGSFYRIKEYSGIRSATHRSIDIIVSPSAAACPATAERCMGPWSEDRVISKVCHFDIFINAVVPLLCLRLVTRVPELQSSVFRKAAPHLSSTR
jgi:hypothetical protein